MFARTPSSGKQMVFNFRQFAFELSHQIGSRLNFLNRTDTLATAPYVLPSFGFLATKVHFARVTLRQMIRIHACIANGGCQVIAMHSREQVAVDDVIGVAVNDALLVGIGSARFIAEARGAGTYRRLVER